MKKGIILAVIAVLFFSTSPIFTRTAFEFSPHQVAFFRMLGGSFFIATFKLGFARQRISLREFKTKYIIYGIITAFHFLFYIYALFYISIAHTLVLVYTAPVYVYLYELIKGYRVKALEVIGLCFTLAGLIILVGFEPEADLTFFVGAGMAFVSALCLSIYSLFGRREKDHSDLLTYTFWLYLMSAVVLFPFALNNWQVSSSIPDILSLVGLALFPTALGHTIYNWALRNVRSFYPSLIATQEVTGGIILGALLLGEIPTIQTLGGTILSLAGIILIVYLSHQAGTKS